MVEAYVRYADGIETVPDGEADAIAGIIEAMTSESRKVAERDGHTVRASHAKSTGLLKGTMRVHDGLAEPLAQGVFAIPRQYDVVARLAQGPGERLSDSVSTHRGMAVRVFGVDGPALPGFGGGYQDFVFATGTTFPQATATTFLTAIKGLEKGVNQPEAVKAAVSTVARTVNAALNAVGADSPTAGFFGHTKRSPLSDAYFSQAALRHGDYVAKLGLFPVSPDLVAAIDETLDTSTDPDAFRTAVVRHMRANGAEFELRVQLCTGLDAMPVEDAATVWPEDQSPYRTVATLSFPPQDAYSPARARFFDEAMSFQPSHSLQAHRPLGSLMRARLATYPALARFRHQAAGVAEQAPGGVADIPD